VGKRRNVRDGGTLKKKQIVCAFLPPLLRAPQGEDWEKKKKKQPMLPHTAKGSVEKKEFLQ